MPPAYAEPKLQFFTQRIDGRPFVNCMFYALCSVLRWAGWAVSPTFGMDLRLASGKPLINPVTGEGQGSSIADSKRALVRLGMTSGLRHGQMTEAELLEYVVPGIVRVIVRMDDRLLPYVRRWCGKTWVGGHAVAIAGSRICNGRGTGRHADHRGVREVLWLDPMAYGSYKGDWLPWNEVKANLSRGSIGYYVTGSLKGAALLAEMESAKAEAEAKVKAAQEAAATAVAQATARAETAEAKLVQAIGHGEQIVALKEVVQ